MVPVAGVPVKRVPDTFAAARAGGRRHNATDILAPRGTPVVAADAGWVVKLSRNAAGGTTIYASDPASRFVFYYAHLDRYHSGLAEGMKLAKGQVIGYVGTTGNAPENIPHLHFQAMRARDVRRWWEGVPVDVRPYLVEDGERR
jgi:murein DD-endopeptidase MepM/ murein hydrolase activator NlpD